MGEEKSLGKRGLSGNPNQVPCETTS